jgi:uncharacterized repeat protein (TIGR01451 family)
MKHRPGVARTRWTLITLSGLILLQLQGLLGGTALAANSACNGAFSGSPVGTLAMTASVPNGGSIAAGQTIDITITWDPTDWSGLDQLEDCFTVNGALDGSLTFEEKPPANDGIAKHSVTVPSTLTSGDTLCARSRLSGQPIGGNTTTQKSNTLCWTVGSTPKNPDVTVAKSADSTSVASGDRVTFTITASNTGDATATNVQIKDTIDGSLTIISASNSCSTSGQTVTCNVGDLAKGASASVSITVKTTDASCPSVANHATVSASNEASAQAGNNTSNTVTVNVGCSTPKPDVTIRKGSDAPAGGVRPGDRFTYTITVDSVGGATAKDVVVHDTIPSGLTIVSASNSCSTSGQTVTCHLGDLAGGSKASVSITVEATDAACPDVTNTATVTSSNEATANQGNNSSNDVTDLVNCTQPGIAVRIVKTNDADGDGTYTDSEEARRSGQDVPFKLVILNTGTPDIDITDLTDEFDQQTQDLLANKCPDLLRLVLASGESITCTFTLNDYSPPATSSGLVNTAKVCAENQTGDKTACDSDTSKVTSAEVLGKTITPTPPGGVAFTGSGGTTELGLIALLLLLLGTGMIRAGYRRRARYLS